MQFFMQILQPLFESSKKVFNEGSQKPSSIEYQVFW